MQKPLAVLLDDLEFQVPHEIGQSSSTNDLDKLLKLLQILENNCSKNRIQFYWAETVDHVSQLAKLYSSNIYNTFLEGMISEKMQFCNAN